MKSVRLAPFALVLIGILLTGYRPAQAVLPAGEAPSNPVDKIDPFLLKQFETASAADYFILLTEKTDLGPAALLPSKEAKGRFVFDALLATAESTQQDLRQFLAAQGADFRPYYIANAILVRDGSQDLLYQVAARPDVAEILANRTYQLEQPKVNPKGGESPETVGGNIAFVQADQVWSLGYTGQGIVLAANDTGLDWEHPAIIDHYRGWDGLNADHNYNWWDPTGTYPAEPGDGFGHGTHVTGTMVGDDGAGNQIGMAPGAQTVHCKNLDDGGSGLDSWILECFEWDLAPWDLNGANPQPALAPDAINNSWGYPGGNNTIFEEAVANLQAAGILVEVSAGNEGPSCQSLRSPGDYGEVLTTGSVSWDNQSLPGSLSFFSSRGPSPLSPDFLPDVTAPGENVRSSLPGGVYENWDGTSMAGPHVVGLAGLMWSANPALRGFVDATQQILFSTTVPLVGQPGSNCGGDYTTGPNHDWGYGTIDALAAVNASLIFGGAGTLTGTVTDSSTNDPLPGVLVSAELNPDFIWTALTNGAGQYTRLVFSGTYTVSAGLYGYFPASFPGVVVTEDVTTTLDIALDPAPAYLVSGTVTDAAGGWPLYARIDIGGYPYGPVFSDPETGAYSISLASGIAYTFSVSTVLQGYDPQTRSVGPLGGPQTEDFVFEANTFLCSAPGYLPDYVYFEDFESGDGGYTVEGTSSWEWGVPTSGPGVAHSGQNVWATNLTGNYFEFEFGFLVSPEIDMSAFAGQSIVVSWWQWLQTEQDFDFAWVDVSNDGGGNWTTIYGPVSGVTSSNLIGGGGGGPWDKLAFILDSSYAVSNLKIRFALQTDGSVNFPGFYVDDVGVGPVFVPPSLYADDFESDDGGYTVSGATTSWEWGTPTKGPSGAHSGVNVWATDLDDDYGNNEDGYITSPAIDLSAAAELSLGRGGGGGFMFLSYWQWLQTESGYDFASVEVFDGTDWTVVYSNSGPIDTDWVKTFIELDDSYAIPNFRVRFRLTSDGSVTYPGFYVDDVAVDLFSANPLSVACNVQAGGLAFGNVYDANTGSALDGAGVSGPSGSAISFPTPDDLALDDGFYTLFAPAGPQILTASLAGYGDQSQSPAIPLGDSVRQDFDLPAALLAADPSALEVTLNLGQSTSVNMSLENNGGAEAAFEIREAAGVFTPTALAAVQVPAYQPPSEEEAEVSYASQSGQAPEAQPAFTYTVPAGTPLSAGAINTLLLAAADVTQIQSILGAYPDLALSYYDARAATPSLGELQAYEVVVVISNFSFADPAGMGDVLADYVDAGGAVVQTVPTFFDPGGFGWGLQGRFITDGYGPFIGTGDWFLFAELGAFDASHPIMAGVTYAGDELRQIMDLDPDAEWVASWTDDEFVAVKDRVVGLNTFIADGAAWVGDVPLIVHNSIVFAVTGADVPWLATKPVTGTVSAEGAVNIQVFFDAGVAEVTQPGTYTAALRVTNDGPYATVEVPVTMNVNPPEGWGKISGTVTGLGYCDAPLGGLEGAAIEIDGNPVVETDAVGNYDYWLDAGTYSVSISLAGYVAQTFELQVSAGQTTLQDAALRLDAPCTDVSPDAIALAVPGALTATLTLDNLGAGTLNYTVLESVFDLNAAAAPFGTPAGTTGSGATPASGPASVLGLAFTSGAPVETPASGWFGALDHPEGIIRYAFAQCAEQPESYYLFGGVAGSNFSLSSKTWRFDASDNTWTELAEAPAGWEAPAAACTQGRIYVMGGSGMTDLFIYNTADDNWSIGASLPRGVEGAAAAAWNGKVFLAGGDNDFFPGSGVSDEVNIYDIASDTWTGYGAPLPEATGNAGFVQTGSYLYIVGGWGTSAPDFNVAATQRYDLENDVWEIGPAFSTARADFALAATAEVLYAIGGDADGGFFFDADDAVEQLDLADWPNGVWADINDPLPVALSANNAGFCTQTLINPAAAEVWSVGGLDTASFTITSRASFREGDGEPCYSIYSDVEWLSTDLVSGSVGGGGGQTLVVTVDPANLSPGVYTATLVIASNDPGSPVIAVTVTVIVGAGYYLFLPIIVR